ncbi:hypothetical protein N5M11_003750 [Vibrio alginolyticus]|nr:hypothetical protein [Vibrio alginolyticus]USD77302.1 hypothetical protein J4N43_24255 [Vibrio sp. SCSIO 43009]EJU9973465.1 hypothetical protein [Vibrio alginolyticus]KPM87173.1 hypothetical protein AOR09_16035 [Vibrio alginolyticus]KPM96746.1 hypothetical protein AOG25_17165 [Vibrio alginolyticus]
MISSFYSSLLVSMTLETKKPLEFWIVTKSQKQVTGLIKHSKEQELLLAPKFATGDGELGF